MIDVETVRRADRSYQERGAVPMKPVVQKVKGEWMAMLWHFPRNPGRRIGYYFHDHRSAVQFVMGLKSI